MNDEIIELEKPCEECGSITAEPICDKGSRVIQALICTECGEDLR